MSISKEFRNTLIATASKQYDKNDPSHDIDHALRVLSLSQKIARAENADLDIVIPAALFHDVISYPKNHPKRLLSSEESANFIKNILKKSDTFSKQKIDKVYEAIKVCSFTKGIQPTFLEAKILQDADRLEAMGAISIMRTFSSAGVMNRRFYDPVDPFCKKRKPDDSKYALDLFFTRLLVIQKRLHTRTAKTIAKQRLRFLKSFLIEFNFELMQNK
jgi:uncharacterized protein